MQTKELINFENTYHDKLAPIFYQEIEPINVREARLLKLNRNLADDLNIDFDLVEKYGAEVFSGNKQISSSKPIAQAYAGHQFGHFVAQLGDGRAILLGEVIDNNGERRDIQLKGSGQTAFSRNGDGKATLSSVLREYLMSEAMHNLGIATTRSLAVVTTGEEVLRDPVQEGAVLTRVAASHIRVGTFEYFAARQDQASLKQLVNYVIDRHYPHIKDSKNPYLELIRAVAKKQTKLISNWLRVGFIHGVMNTDNTTISGETIDYGPCAFMNFYNPATVFSSIDHFGRYAYQNQASIIVWNISVLANTLKDLIADNEMIANKLLDDFFEEFQRELTAHINIELLSKLGLTFKKEEDHKLVKEFLYLLHKYRADFTLSFRYLADFLKEEEVDNKKFYSLFDQENEAKQELNDWIIKWKARAEIENTDFKNIIEKMNSINPLFIPRNHKVEEALSMAREGDLSYFEKLNKVLENPYTENKNFDDYKNPPKDKDEKYQTFCGT